jgi:hypothetical protein
MSDETNLEPYYAAAADGRPAVAADPHIWHAAAVMLARLDGSTADGSDDAASSVIDDAETMLRHAALQTGSIGDYDTLRAAYAWHGAEGHAAEPTSYDGPLPDWTVSGQSTVTRKRSNSGRTATTVTRHGRSWTVGSTRPVVEPTDMMRQRYADMAAAALDGIRGSVTAALDGRQLVQMTDYLYDLPAMIGGDLTSWSEVLPDDVSARVAATAWNPAAWIDDTMPATAERKRTARRMTWPTRYRVTAGGNTRADETRQTVTRLPRSWSRSMRGTRSAVTVTRADGTSWFRVTELPSVSADGLTVTVGHGKPRPRSMTVKQSQRSTRTSYAVVVPRSLPLADGLAAAAVDMARGDRVAWRDAASGMTGSMTLSGSGHYAARVTGAAWKVRTRTVNGLRAAVRSNVE